ncbi:hypothetical protein ONS95_011777 [Cadophora gregata]|uniref:uncharacterized protein n=1 Tax=Cadophora gregata TaxID=51156 RepID=UPI0026DBA461|nr:uncharacterized protein ONS95_011777 [Cadophora gregata]KAK0120375.1 hypothetical protein ONS95_011777 [Cadophora gregata]KAK0121402.1 hypothetical protein ONS96_011573 [Cadophora gregata f. sp. sojae]
MFSLVQHSTAQTTPTAPNRAILFKTPALVKSGSSSASFTMDRGSRISCAYPNYDFTVEKRANKDLHILTTNRGSRKLICGELEVYLLVIFGSAARIQGRFRDGVLMILPRWENAGICYWSDGWMDVWLPEAKAVPMCCLGSTGLSCRGSSIVTFVE